MMTRCWSLGVLLFAAAVCAGEGSEVIRLRSGVLDTRIPAKSGAQAITAAVGAFADEAALGALTPTEQDGHVSVLVQYARPITSFDRQALAGLGAAAMHYVPDQALLLLVRPAALDRLRALDGVRWVGAYTAGMKTDPALKEAPKAASNDREGEPGSPEWADVVISVFRPGYTAVISNQVESLGGTVVESGAGKRWGTVRARVEASCLETLAAYSEVEWIEPYRQPEWHNNVAVNDTLMNVRTVWTNYGLTGAGQVVGVGDSGLDTGNTNTIHPDFLHRIRAAFGLVSAVDWSDHNGHGTHTTGSILGNGEAYSNGLYRGVAYEAEVVFQALGDTNGASSVFTPSPLTRLFIQAYSNDARIHSDSWGSNAEGAYDSSSRYVDEFMWDYDDMLILFSAGNAGRDTNSTGVIEWGSMGSPATAKNCLSVGAAESLRASGSGGYSDKIWGTGSWLPKYPADPIRSDLVSTPWDGTNRGMAAFSSRGPCDDQRIKPDVVAPGTDIISCRSHVPGAGTLWGTGTGLLANSASNDYCFSGGTSMATPLTAGAAALVRQYVEETRSITNPSAALLKALLIGGARSMDPGQYGTNEYREISGAPNIVEGWGHVNLGSSIFPEEDRQNLLADRHTVHTGETNSYAIILTNESPVTVTLVWSDYPAAAASALQLVNDLDVRLIDPDGAVTYPNGLGGADHTNNVERISLSAGKAGTNRIEVSGFNVPEGPQSYALVIQAAGSAQTDMRIFGFCVKPVSPYQDAPITLRALVSSNALGLAAVVAAWQVNSNGWHYCTMTPQGGDDWGCIYQAELPSFEGGDILECCMYAMSYDMTFLFTQTNRLPISSTELFVTSSGTAQWPYNTWESAFDSIQDALDFAQDGFTITVTNGIYREGLISVEKAVTLRSLNGAANTIMDGLYEGRCLSILDPDAQVDGFTLYRGYTLDGGGVYMTGGTLSSSVVQSCVSERYGGGVLIEGGRITDTVIKQCSSGRHGGGMLTRGGLVEHSLFYDNDSVNDGGGMEFWGGMISNCTVAFNHADGYGGGIDVGDIGIVYNTIIVSNSATVAGQNWYEWVEKDFRFCCASPNPGEPGGIDVDPLFVNSSTRNLHLKSTLGHYLSAGGWSSDSLTSPCIDLGGPASDYSREPVPNGDRINIGAYGGTPQASKGDTNTYKYIVDSFNGGVDPQPGVYTNNRGAEITCAVTSPVISGVTSQYIHEGWTLSGLSDAEGFTAGTGTGVTFALTNSGLLTWSRHTNLYASIRAGEHGSLSGTTGGWFSLNETVTVVAVSDVFYGFSGWTGTLTAVTNPLNVTMTSAHDIWAGFSALRTSNGVPQWWLANYGWTGDFEAAAAADPDQDGASSGQEYVAGTNPTNSLSVLELHTSGGVGSPVVLAWQACADRTYTVQWSTNLPGGITNRLFSIYTAVPVPMVIEDSVHTNEQSLYYRIRAACDQ